MSDTWRGSLSIRLPNPDRAGGTVDRWARVDLEDYFWLGRCSICNLVVQGDTLISRLHATIQRENDDYRLTDMQSMNGTLVNDRHVKSAVLRPGDTIEMGESRLVFSPQRPADTLFEANSTRSVGTSTLTLRSYPCSLTGAFSVPSIGAAEERPPPAPSVHATMTSRGPESRVDTIRPRPPVSVTDAVPPLEQFLTIVIDRVVSELKASAGVIHVPSVAGSTSVTIARSFKNGLLGVLDVPPDLPGRVEKVLPVAMLQADQTFPEVGEVLQWTDQVLKRRIKPGEQFPRHSGSGTEITVPLPRVGRVNPDQAIIRQHDAMAWIHVSLEPSSPDSAIPRLVEVAGGTAASIVRYLERGR